MNLSCSNFLYAIKQLVVGGDPPTTLQAADGGFLRDIDITRATGGIGASTISSTAIVVGPFIVPRDYDETYDTLQLHLLGSTNATGSTLIVAALTTVAKPGSSTTVSLGPTSTRVDFSSTSTYTPFTISLSGLGLKRDTVYNISTLTPGSSHIFPVRGGNLTYASDLVAYDGTGREQVGTTQQMVRG